MDDNNFFKPTALYKEFMILDLIEKDANITQRKMSSQLGVAVSMINSYLDEYEKNGYIKRKYKSTKSVEYFISKKGLERKKVLNIGYLKDSQILYNSAKENIVSFLNQITNKGFNKIILYGAGEVAEILLQTIVFDKTIPIKILAVIDDDEEKQNQILLNSKIISVRDLKYYEHDGILISSYSNKNTILKELIKINYNTDKILNFFEI